MFIRKTTIIAACIGVVVGLTFNSCTSNTKTVPAETVVETSAVETEMAPHVVLAMEPDKVDTSTVVLTSTTEAETEPIIEEEPEIDILTEDEIELIALVTMAEAEGESEEGQRLVISTILNRVDHASFPDTVHGVIYQKGAFSSMWDGRANRCYVREDFVELVRDELENRSDANPIYFRTGHYSKYGTPMYKVGNHYFSSF